jgi:hypothetical protein
MSASARTPILMGAFASMLMGAVASRGTFSGIGLQSVGLSWATAGTLAGKIHDATIANAAPHPRQVTSAEALSGNMI